MRSTRATEIPVSAPTAELFHEASKLPTATTTVHRSIDDGVYTGPLTQSEAKVYRTGTRVPLPVTEELMAPLTHVLDARRSVRTFGDEAVTLWQVGQLLGWSAGVRQRSGEELATGRCAPSAGARYPIEIYVAARHVSDLTPGLYHYDAFTHSLASVTDCAAPALVAARDASLYPEIVGGAQVLVIMAAVFARSVQKYGERGYRFTLLDCGHIAQNLHIVCHAVGLHGVALGGFLDDRLNDTLDLDGVTEAVVHTIALGRG